MKDITITGVLEDIKAIRKEMGEPGVILINRKDLRRLELSMTMGKRGNNIKTFFGVDLIEIPKKLYNPEIVKTGTVLILERKIVNKIREMVE